MAAAGGGLLGAALKAIGEAMGSAALPVSPMVTVAAGDAVLEDEPPVSGVWRKSGTSSADEAGELAPDSRGEGGGIFAGGAALKGRAAGNTGASARGTTGNTTTGGGADGAPMSAR